MTLFYLKDTWNINCNPFNMTKTFPLKTTLSYLFDAPRR